MTVVYVSYPQSGNADAGVPASAENALGCVVVDPAA
jgi:hypothetical protein